jgi:hypothetical protein
MISDIELNAQLEIGSFEYLPRNFLGIETSKFGHTVLNPFMKLKEKIYDENVLFADKCQAIRYMCHIPHKQMKNVVIECCKHILSNESVPVDERFYFFSNNEKYFKLEDNVVYELFPWFFERCLNEKYPYLITILCCKYIIRTFTGDLKQKAKNFLYSVINDVNEQYGTKMECIDTLLEYGDKNDQEYCMPLLDETQEVHQEHITTSVRKMLRNLIKDRRKLKVVREMEDIHKYLLDKNRSDLMEVLTRVLMDPSKYDGYTLSDILLMVWNTMFSMEQHTGEMLKRFIQELEEMKGVCSTGLLSRILNILSGFVNDEDYNFKINIMDVIRSDIFQRYNNELRRMPPIQQEEILNSLCSDDKQVAEEFLTYYDIKDELYYEYKDRISNEDFERIYEKTKEEYIGK